MPPRSGWRLRTAQHSPSKAGGGPAAENVLTGRGGTSCRPGRGKMGRGCQLQQLGPKASALGQELPWLVPAKLLESPPRAPPWGEACRAPSPQSTQAPPVRRWSSGETASPGGGGAVARDARESRCRVSVPGSLGLGHTCDQPQTRSGSVEHLGSGHGGECAVPGSTPCWASRPRARQDCVPCLKTGLNGLRSLCQKLRVPPAPRA